MLLLRRRLCWPMPHVLLCFFILFALFLFCCKRCLVLLGFSSVSPSLCFSLFVFHFLTLCLLLTTFLHRTTQRKRFQIIAGGVVLISVGLVLVPLGLWVLVWMSSGIGGLSRDQSITVEWNMHFQKIVSATRRWRRHWQTLICLVDVDPLSYFVSGRSKWKGKQRCRISWQKRKVLLNITEQKNWTARTNRKYIWMHQLRVQWFFACTLGDVKDCEVGYLCAPRVCQILVFGNWQLTMWTRRASSCTFLEGVYTAGCTNMAPKITQSRW